MDFALATLAPKGHFLDVDNLCEPMFSVMASGLGWFHGSRPRVEWWSATKRVGVPTGCTLSRLEADGPESPRGRPTLRETYRGVLPSSATSPEVATWAAVCMRQSGAAWPESCVLRLEFGSRVLNIASISSGGVKAFVDCLFPFYGGLPGRPEDHRIQHLIVQRGVADLDEKEVRVSLWNQGRRPVSSQAHAADQPKSASVHSPSRPTSAPPASRSSVAISNPCAPNTRKWVVLECARKGQTKSEAVLELDRLWMGAGARLGDYIGDIRSENRIDIRVEDGRLVIHGRL